MNEPVRDGRARWVTAAVVLLAWVHAWTFRMGLSDDGLISMRYARRLATGRGLTWNDGEYVEGYSDLLWVLGLAAFELVGIEGPIGGQLLGGLGFTLAVLAVSVDPATLRLQTARAATAGLTLALAAPLAVWAVGGLEHTLVAGVTVAALVAIVRDLEVDDPRSRWAGAALLGAATLLRADGAVLVVGASLGVVLGGGLRAWRTFLVVAGLPAVLWSAQLGFRVWYYGDWVPNTARIKVSGKWERTVFGVGWMGRALLANGLMVAPALAAAVWLRRAGPRLWVPAATALLWIVYVAVVGGDIFAGWRQLVPALPALVMLLGEAASRMRWTRVQQGVVAVLLVAHGAVSTLDPQNDRARDETWTGSSRHLGELVRTAFPERLPLVAVDAAGALPYFIDGPSLDMLGLSDPWLPHHPPKEFGKTQIGHDLGNHHYVLGREPDLIAFNSSNGSSRPHWPADKRLINEPSFQREYTPVVVETPRPERVRAMWYTPREGPLGVTRSPGRIEVPGWLFSGRNSHSHLDDAGRLVGTASANPVSLRNLPVGAGRWLVRAEPADVQLTVTCGESAAGESVLVEMIDPGRIELSVTALHGRHDLQRVVVERTTDASPAGLGCRSETPTVARLLIPGGGGTLGEGALPVDERGLVVHFARPRKLDSATLTIAGVPGWRFSWLRRDRVVKRGILRPGEASPSVVVAAGAPKKWVDGLRLDAPGGTLGGLTLQPTDPGDGPAP